MTSIIRKGTAGLLALLMCLSALFGAGVPAAEAAGETSLSVSIAFPRDGDVNENPGQDTWGHPALTFLNGWHAGTNTRWQVYSQGDFTSQVCYCIEPGVHREIDDVYTSFGEDFWDNYPAEYNDTIAPDTIKLLLGRILQYGYQGNVSTGWRTQNEEDADKLAHVMATQILVWETVVGERDEYFNHVDTGGKDPIRAFVSKNHPLYDRYDAWYDSMVKSVRSHTVIPSFMARTNGKADTVELSWNGSVYEAVLTDSNGVLSKFSFTSDAEGIGFAAEGNRLTVTADRAPSGPVTIAAEKEQKRAGILIWSDGIIDPGSGIQDVATYAASVKDPVKAYLKAAVSTGDLRIRKTSEDGKVSGVTFVIEGNGVSKTVKTGSDGTVTAGELQPGTYTVTEETDARYEPQEAKTVTVENGKTAEVSFANTLRRGDLKIVKTSEDGKVEGISFRVTGEGFDKTAKTDAKGEILLKDLLPGTYTVTEETPGAYEEQKAKTVTVAYGKTAEVAFTNTLRRGDLKIVKTSEDGKIEGISFRVTGNGFDRTAKTGAKGEILLEDLLPGTYTVTEETTDLYEPQKAQSVTVAYGKTAEVSFRNTLKKGTLRVTKTAEDGLSEGIAFRLSGTAANGAKVDRTAKTDAKGVALFENVPVGTSYTVEETDTAAKYVVPEKQSAAIKWNEVTSLSFDNRLKRGSLVITKTAEDGLREGVRFRLSGTAGNGDRVDLYAVTDASGKAKFENVLIGDRYTVEETETAERYVVPESRTAKIEWAKVTELSFENILKRGSLRVTKTSEDGLREGVRFRLSGTALSGEKVDEVRETGSDGTALFEEIPIGEGYTVEEVGTKSWYVVPDPQAAVIEWAKVTELAFENLLKRGELRVTKTAEDGLPEGLEFRLTGTSDAGIAVDVTAVTGEDGTAVFRDIPIGSGYVVAEVGTPARYVIPEEQTADVLWNEVTELGFSNVLKKFRVLVTKADRETGGPQGDATLAGAVYGLYRDGELQASYTTGADGLFTTDYFPCGDGWTLREIAPSEGYLLDETEYPVGAGAELFEIEWNEVEAGVGETVVQGRISILKHCDGGETGADTPEEGAEFEVWRKSAGSYEDAPESERDLLVCDENGFAETKDLPYGTYTVRQISGWEGREKIEDFDVFLSEDGAVCRFLLNNAVFRSRIRVVKKDAETGKVIPYAGAGFRILDPRGEPVTMTVTYPETVTLDVFRTSSSGTLITPEALEYGRGYSLVEAEAPYGYVLDPEPVFFDVTEEGAEGGDGAKIITVEKTDAPQKGRISILKTGEVFASVRKSGERYVPVYEERGLEGAVFEIAAAEDIVTPDGTVRLKKGETAETVVTDKEGLAVSGELYLGKYTVRETEAPTGMALDREERTAELAYAGQEVRLAETKVSLRDERQKASVSLQKTLEKDGLFGAGENGEILSVRFGLFAAKEMKALDGSVIPEGGLLAEASCGEDGRISFDCDVPVDSELFVKETATNFRYALSVETWPVSFPYAGSGTALLEIAVNGGKEIPNALLRGAVRGVKTDGDGNAVKGALFGLFRADEEDFDASHALMTSVSDENGLFRFAGLVYGDYAVREIAAAEGFVPNAEVIPVTVGKSSEVVEIGFENLPVCGTAELTKVDEDYPENRLTGAEFEIWLDLDGDGAFDAEKDVLLGLMEEVGTGVYRREGLRYGGYFAYERKAPEGFRKDEGHHYFEIREDGETVTVENEAGVGFLDEAEKGAIRIRKTSEDGVLQGFAFRVEGEDLWGNAFEGEYVTGEEGEIRIEGLRAGTYTVTEIGNEASGRYILPEGVTVTVRGGETAEVEAYNALVPETPHTGDDSRTALWAALAALSLAGLGILLAASLRRKSKGGRTHER